MAVLFTLPIACAIFGPQDQEKQVAPQSWLRSRGPVVPHDSFPADCSLCHETGNWHEVKADFEFDHAKEAGLSLNGVHDGAECLRCHNDRGPVVAFAARGCPGCHEDQHERKLGLQCDSCHSEQNWIPKGQIARHARTRFPLIGSHAGIACFRCHPGAQTGNFNRASTHCETCHGQDMSRATKPDHSAQGWTSDCGRCHSPTSWTGAGFDHQIFPLSGSHRAVACRQCHRGNVFRGTSSACFSCHQADYERSTRPDHRATGTPTTCKSCHNTASFKGAVFTHSGFALVGAHAAANCSACHKGGIFRGTSKDCFTCHQADYNATLSPNHRAAGTSTLCQNCHNTATWKGAQFNHTSFPLAGAHGGLDCARCHKGGVFQGTSKLCYSCHQQSYNQTTNPPHAAAGFPTTCESCHNTSSFLGAKFNHTSYPLTGMHAGAACARCHGNGVYRGTSRDCYSCHQQQYNQTTNPPHQTSGFPTTCASCHNTSSFKGAQFNHTTFVLTGAHIALACSSCHGNGVFRGTPQNCYACHQQNYNQTTNPPHTAAGFSTNCASCHNTSSFRGAKFNHTTFALTGAHLATTCTSCHKGGIYRGTARDCVSCHRAAYNGTTNPPHLGAGFPTTCASCHNTSSFKGANFNHKFPLSGKHNPGCTTCHRSPSNFKQFDCLSTCHEHSKTKMDDKHKNRNGYSYASAVCYGCHPQGKK